MVWNWLGNTRNQEHKSFLCIRVPHMMDLNFTTGKRSIQENKYLTISFIFRLSFILFLMFKQILRIYKMIYHSSIYDSLSVLELNSKIIYQEMKELKTKKPYQFLYFSKSNNLIELWSNCYDFKSNIMENTKPYKENLNAVKYINRPNR